MLKFLSVNLIVVFTKQVCDTYFSDLFIDVLLKFTFSRMIDTRQPWEMNLWFYHYIT